MIFFQIFCHQCGHQFDLETRNEFAFCPECGAKIALTEAAAAQMSAEAASAPVQETAPYEAPVSPEPIAPAQQSAPAAVPPVMPAQQPVVPVDAAAPFVAAAAVASPAPQPYAPPSPPVIRAELPLAISYYNRRDYASANQCLALLKTSEPENAGVWFCACKLLAAQHPADILQACEDYVASAAECLRLSPDPTENRGHLTVEFNRFLQNMVITMEMNKCYFASYDSSMMSEPIPSPQFNPLAEVDRYYGIFTRCVDDFRAQVNPSYSSEFFDGLWGKSLYTTTHIISQKLVSDLKNARQFYWYRTNLRSRTVNDIAATDLCKLLYNYKCVCIGLFNRIRFKGVRNNAFNGISFADKWLLKVQILEPNGRYRFAVPQPQQRAALEQEIQYYKKLLLQS